MEQKLVISELIQILKVLRLLKLIDINMFMLIEGIYLSTKRIKY